MTFLNCVVFIQNTPCKMNGNTLMDTQGLVWTFLNKGRSKQIFRDVVEETDKIKEGGLFHPFRHEQSFNNVE